MSLPGFELTNVVVSSCAGLGTKTAVRQERLRRAVNLNYRFRLFYPPFVVARVARFAAFFAPAPLDFDFAGAPCRDVAAYLPA